MTSIEIKELRETLGLSQERFAHLLGVCLGSVSRWEKDRCKPSLLAVDKLKALTSKKKVSCE